MKCLITNSIAYKNDIKTIMITIAWLKQYNYF